MSGGVAAAVSSVVPSTAWPTSTAASLVKVDPMSLVNPEFRGPLEAVLSVEATSP